MKIHKWFSIIIVVSVLLLSIVSTVKAVPPLPSSFYGRIKINGENISEGAILKAVINGEEFALAIIDMFEGDSVYSLDVPGDDPTTTSVVEGGIPGDSVYLKLGSNLAYQTGTWAGGTNLEMDLTFDEPTPPVMPSSFYGTVKINDNNVPTGTIIKAVINGVTYTTCTVSLYGGKTVYAINIPGDDPGTTSIIEGGVNGDTVQFFIGDLPADQTGTWLSETNNKIDLTFHQDILTPEPSNFYGTVKVNGENVPVGTIIKAFIDGVEFASTNVTLQAGVTAYEISVPADDPGTVAIEGGVNGDTVQFLIGTLSAEQTGTWMSDTNTEINLTVSEPKIDFPFFFSIFYG